MYSFVTVNFLAIIALGFHWPIYNLVVEVQVPELLDN